MADDLNITASAYSKIETGRTDPSYGRLKQIATILGVDIIYLIQEPGESSIVTEPLSVYQHSSKDIVQGLADSVRLLQQDVAVLKAALATVQSDLKGRKSK